LITVLVDPENLIDETLETNNNASRNLTVELNQTSINRAPLFVSYPVLVATAGVRYTYNFNAFDQDGDVLTYSNGQKPLGMSFDGPKKILDWTPGLTDKGEHGIVLMVTDGKGGEGEQVYILTVIVKMPKCHILIPTADQVVSGLIWINGTSLRGGPPIKTVLVRIDGGTWMIANQTINWSYAFNTKVLTNGKHTAEAKANDGIMDSNISKVQFIVENKIPMPPKKYGTYLEGFPWVSVAVVSTSTLLLVLIDYLTDRQRSVRNRHFEHKSP
jgi:hypothetical protein